MSIPKVIFQTSAKPSPDYIRRVFTRLSPDWTYLHFTDFDILRYFDSHPTAEFPRLREVFNSFSRGEHKADLFRYYYLYLNGGLFVDSDAIPNVPLSEITQGCSSILVLPFDARNGIYNGIIGCTPRSPLLYEALKHCYNTPAAVLEDSYHYLCKSLGTLASAYKQEGNVFFQEVNMVDSGIEGSIVVDNNQRQIFTHYWKLGYVPSETPLRRSISSPKPNDCGGPRDTATAIPIRKLADSALSIARSILNRSLRHNSHTRYASEFDEVYLNNKWGCGSGPGSSIKNTAIYNEFIISLLKTVRATQVTDIGCGDWQSSYLIYDQLGIVDYQGIDCASSVIKENQRKHPRYSFKCLDVVASPELIRDSEVYIIKDMLQHLRTKDIYKILNALSSKAYKYIIIANYCGQSNDDEELPNIKDVSRSRGLKADLYPLKHYGTIPILNYYGAENKEVGIIINRTNWNHFAPEQTWAFNMASLRIFDTGSSLQRLGPDSDGGYVIHPGISYDLLISCGIAHDIRFEEAFLRIYPSINCFALDGTIQSFPSTELPIEWVQKNVAAFPGHDESDLTEFLHSACNVFLKMDIEGSEFDWIAAASIETLNKFAQIVLEVHWPFDQFRVKALDKIATTHCPLHVHGNNYNDEVIPKHLPSGRSLDGTILVRDSIGELRRFPEVFEVTYLRKDLMPPCSKQIRKDFPTNLDFPNCPSIPDLTFTI